MRRPRKSSGISFGRTMTIEWTSISLPCWRDALPTSWWYSCFGSITNHMTSVGRLAIDLSLSSLCSGMHDLKEGLRLLHMASLWLRVGCQSRQRYEAVNAYLHRLLYIPANVFSAGMDATNERKWQTRNTTARMAYNSYHSTKRSVTIIIWCAPRQDVAHNVLDA